LKVAKASFWAGESVIRQAGHSANTENYAKMVRYYHFTDKFSLGVRSDY
jgi:TolA-binding protein